PPSGACPGSRLRLMQVTSRVNTFRIPTVTHCCAEVTVRWGPGPVARQSVLLAGRPVREVGGYPGLVQVVGLTARLGGRDRALVIRESEMSQHAPDRWLVTIWAAQLLVDDLVGRQPELVVQLAPAGLALGDQGLQGGDELVVVARPARGGRPRRLWLADGVDPHPVLGHPRPGDRLTDPVTSRDIYDPQVGKRGAEDRGPVQAGEAGHLRKLRQCPSQAVPVDLGAEHAVGSAAQPVHKGQVALSVAHVMTGSVGPLLPEAPVRQLGRILSEEVLLGRPTTPVAARPRHSNSVPLRGL